MIAMSPSSNTRGETEMQARVGKKRQSNNKYRTKIEPSLGKGPLGRRSAWRTRYGSEDTGLSGGRSYREAVVNPPGCLTAGVLLQRCVALWLLYSALFIWAGG